MRTGGTSIYGNLIKNLHFFELHTMTAYPSCGKHRTSILHGWSPIPGLCPRPAKTKVSEADVTLLGEEDILRPEPQWMIIAGWDPPFVSTWCQVARDIPVIHDFPSKKQDIDRGILVALSCR